MTNWNGIPADKIDLVWKLVEPLLAGPIAKTTQTAPDHPTASISKVRELLRAGQYQLWLCHDEGKPRMALVTEVVTADEEKLVQLQLLGGHDLKPILQMFEVIPAWARSLGATKLTALPRPGLARLLERHLNFHKHEDEFGPRWVRDLITDGGSHA